MKVVCIKKEETNKCRNSNRVVPTPEVGSFYTVIGESNYMADCYILEEMPHDVGYEKTYFAPLSNIDETQYINKETETILKHNYEL